MHGLLARAAEWVWGTPTIGLTLAVGLLLTLRTRGFVLRRFGAVLRETFGKIREPAINKGDVTPFMAMSVALGATMGTGNIVGVATALTAGGPGAVFWMWMAALFGMTIKFTEVALAVKHRRLGPGPMGYLKRLPSAGGFLAGLFALICLMASLTTGNMTQSNSFAEALLVFRIPPWVCAAAIWAFTYYATRQGVRGVILFSAWVVPIITIGYIGVSAAVLWQGRHLLGGALAQILGGAFAFRPIAGGVAGYTMRSAMRFGFARGVFSNEAGMGSSPIGHSETEGRDPVRQGMWGVVEVFIDTIISCTLTALVLLTAQNGGLWQAGQTGAPLAGAAFSQALGAPWGAVVSIFIALFGITSICGWFAYGCRALEEFFFVGRAPVGVYRMLYALSAGLGALMNAQAVWLLSDLFAGCQMVVNLCGLVVLSGEMTPLVAAWETGTKKRVRDGTGGFSRIRLKSGSAGR